VLQVETPDEKKDLVEALASGTGRRILFTRTKHQAKKLAKQLTAAGIPAVDLHGNLSQNARERNLGAFSSDPAEGGVRVLVATDVAARGVHVDNVELVVHVDPPTEHKAYLHRSGRTARAGSSGDVVTVTMPAERRDVAQMMRAAAIKVTPQHVTSTSAAVTALVGEVAPIRHVAEEQPTQQRQPKQRSAESAGDGGGRRRGRGGRSGGAAQPARSGSAGESAGSAGGRQGRPARGARSEGAGRSGAAAAGSTGGRRSGGNRRSGSSDVVRGGSSAVWSSEGGYAAGRSGNESGGNRRGGSRRASRPAGAADRH